MKDISGETLDDFSCPVCLEILISPIYQCYNGHLICHDCLPKLSKCPVCRDELPEWGKKRIRNLFIEKLSLEKKFPCRNTPEGCPETELTPGEIKSHFWDCSYEPQNYCRLLRISQNCPKFSTKSDIYMHLQSEHPEISGLHIPNGEKVQIVQEIPQDLIKSSKTSKVQLSPMYFHQFGQIFVVHTYFCRKTGTFFWSPKITCSSTEARKFQVKINIFGGSKNSSIIQLEGQPSSLEIENEMKLSCPLTKLQNHIGVVGKMNLSWIMEIRLEKLDMWDYTSTTAETNYNSSLDLVENNDNEYSTLSINPLRIFNRIIQSEEISLLEVISNSANNFFESDSMSSSSRLEWNFKLIVTLCSAFALFVR